MTNNKKQIISISLSKEHGNYISDIKDCFYGIDNLDINADLYRLSMGDLPMQVYLFLGGAISSGIIYDLIKVGISKFYKKFQSGHISIIGDSGIMFSINKNLEVHPVVTPDRLFEFKSINNIDDLILYLKKLSNNNLPDGWIETTLGEVCDIKGGKRLPKGENLVNYKTNHPYIRITDLENNSINKKQLQFVTDEVFSSISRYIVNSGDVIISIVGSVGFVAKIDDDLDNASLTENCVKLVNLKNLDSIYLYYYLISQVGQNEIQKNTVGAVQKKLPIYGVQNISLSLPPLPEQQAIAKILSSFDEKIELLREQNETLEKMAQTIFGEWFGKYSVDDELPEGWRVYELKELVNCVNGYSYKGDELLEKSNSTLVTLKSFDRAGGFQTRGFKPFIGNPKESQEVFVGDLVVAHTDLTQDAEVLGNPALIFENGGFEKMYITMDLVKVISNNDNISNAFLYYLMKTKEFKGHCIGYSNGTTVLHMSKKAIPEYKILLPKDLALVKKFSYFVKDTTDKVSVNNSQIQTLSKTRDELLPKLMSGKVRVV